MSLVFTIGIGFLLAVLMDQKIRFEDTFRTIMLYPFALSFIVTGLVWQWILNPGIRHPGHRARSGLGKFHLRPAEQSAGVLYGLLIAGLWQGTGFVMCIMLAGLRGIDEDIWKAVARRRHSDLENLSVRHRADDAAGVHHHAGASSQPASSSFTIWSSRKLPAGRAMPARCRRCMSMTTCSRRKIWARGLRHRP